MREKELKLDQLNWLFSPIRKSPISQRECTIKCCTIIRKNQHNEPREKFRGFVSWLVFWQFSIVHNLTIKVTLCLFTPPSAAPNSGNLAAWKSIITMKISVFRWCLKAWKIFMPHEDGRQKSLVIVSLITLISIQLANAEFRDCV